MRATREDHERFERAAGCYTKLFRLVGCIR